MIKSVDYLLIFYYLTISIVVVTKQYSLPQIECYLNSLVIKHIIQLFPMKTKLSLSEAVAKIFGNSLKEVCDPFTEWHDFTPFLTLTGSTILLKLIEVPSNFVTSSEIINKIQQRFKSIIHQIGIIQVQRQLDVSYYLLKTKINLISIQSFLKLKKESHEKIQEDMIIKFIQFAAKLENHKFSKQITFKLNQIGITNDKCYLLSNYDLYFAHPSTKRSTNLTHDIKRTLTQMLMPYQQGQLNLMQLYSYVEENYGQRLLKVVQECLGQTFRPSQILTAFAQHNSSFMDTTLSDSFYSQNINHGDLQNISELGSLLENLLEVKTSKASRKSKLRISALIFVFILLISGAITFQYLKPRPLICEQGEYLDSNLNSCLNCDPSCSRCDGEGRLMCLNCKDNNLFLNKKSRNEKTGQCSSVCLGIVVGQKVCVDNH